MRYLSLSIAFLPLVCGCEQCDWTWLCFTFSTLLAGGLFMALSLLHELQILKGIRGALE